MTEVEKIKRDMDTLLESIRLGWPEIASKPTGAVPVRKYIKWRIGELRELQDRLDAHSSN